MLSKSDQGLLQLYLFSVSVHHCQGKFLLWGAFPLNRSYETSDDECYIFSTQFTNKL